MMRAGWSRANDEQGAASLLVIACCGVLLWLTTALAVAVALVVAHRQAQAAADLAAISAAAHGCAEAAAVAVQNDARLTHCTAAGTDIQVSVSVTGPSAFGWSRDLSATARAGPRR